MTAALIPFADVSADTIYRTTASDGSVVFSDRPAPDATVVRTRPINVVGPDRSGGGEDRGGMRENDDNASAMDVEGRAVTEPGVGDVDVDTASAGVERVEIASPPPDAVLIDAAGPLLVEIGTAPGSLRDSGLHAEILLDGETAASGGSSMLAMPVPERGEHRLQVRLLDVEGRAVVFSEPQALHVRQSVVTDAGDAAGKR